MGAVSVSVLEASYGCASTHRRDLASPIGRTQAVAIAAHCAVHSGGAGMEAPSLVVVQHEGIREALAGMEPAGPEGCIVAVEALLAVNGGRHVLAARLCLALASTTWGLQARDCAIAWSRQAGRAVCVAHGVATPIEEILLRVHCGRALSTADEPADKRQGKRPRMMRYESR